MCNYISLISHFLKSHLHPVALICVLWDKFAHCKTLILPNCCCQGGWTSDALPLTWVLSKHSLSQDGSLTDSISTVLFCLSSCPSPFPPGDPGSEARERPFLEISTCNKARTEGFVQMEMEILTFTAHLLTDGPPPKNTSATDIF